jgi:hypothetical protein
LIGILEDDLPGVYELLENHNDSAAPMLYKLSTKTVSILNSFIDHVGLMRINL